MDLFKQLNSSSGPLFQKFPTLSAKLEENGITVIDILASQSSSSSYKLQILAKKIGRSIRELEEYTHLLEKEVCNSLNQKDLKRNTNTANLHLSTGLDILDKKLGGGIPKGQLTEIFGESGSGKSQFLLQLCANTIRSNPLAQCIYIATESPFESRRLANMSADIDQDLEKSFMERIFCIYCQDLEHQDHVIFTQLPTLLSHYKGKINTVIIDSVSHHLRREEGVSNVSYLNNIIKNQESYLKDVNGYSEIKEKNRRQLGYFFKSSPKHRRKISKAYYISSLYRHLSRLARDYNTAIVSANQVSDHAQTKFSDSSKFFSSSLDLDYQIGQISGWDARTIYEHHEGFVHQHPCKNLTDDINMLAALNPSEGPHKYRKLTKDNDDALYLERKDLRRREMIETFNCKNIETRKKVPTLGYQWNKLVMHRLLFMKRYAPIIQEINCNKKLLSEEERSFLNDRSNSENYYNSSQCLSGPLSGWRIERYIKVVGTLYEGVKLDNAGKDLKIPFKVEKHGVVSI